MPTDLASALMLIVGLLIGAIILTTLGVMGRRGTLERNGAFGIRTSATMRSDAAWEAGQRAGSLTILLAGLTSFSGIPLVLYAVFMVKSASVALTLGLTAIVLTMALAVIAGVQAHRHAQRVSETPLTR